MYVNTICLAEKNS